MNHLNSVLIEGKVLSDPQIIGVTDETYKCEITLWSKRRRYDEDKGEITVITVVGWNNMADRMFSEIVKDDVVRVVGRLMNVVFVHPKTREKTTEVVLICEHFERKVTVETLNRH